MKNSTTFVRVKKNENYTTVHNGFIKRKDLSWKAKGIMTYLLSLPDDWVVNLDEIKRNASDGESSFRSGWKELKDAGYVSKRSIRDEFTKKILKWETIIKEVPDEKKNHNVGNHNVESHQVGNHQVDNRELLSTKELSTNKPSTNKHIDQQSSTDDLSISQRFEKIWKDYPNKQGKKPAFSSYKTALKNGTTDKDIIDGLERYKKHLQQNTWKNSAQGSTWFKQNRWEDDFDDVETNKNAWAGSDF